MWLTFTMFVCFYEVANCCCFGSYLWWDIVNLSSYPLQVPVPSQKCLAKDTGSSTLFLRICVCVYLYIYIYMLPSRFSSVRHSMMISRSTRLLLQIDYCIGLLVLFLEPIHYRSQKSLSSSGEGIGSVHLMATNCWRRCFKCSNAFCPVFSFSRILCNRNIFLMNKIQQTRVSKDSLLRSVILSFSAPNLYLLETTFYHFRRGYSTPFRTKWEGYLCTPPEIQRSGGKSGSSSWRRSPTSSSFVGSSSSYQVTGLKARVSG